VGKLNGTHEVMEACSDANRIELEWVSGRFVKGKDVGQLEGGGNCQ
jgi:hypothetical protein